jgi:tetratricopeptide (TPR) repeat protein
LSALRELVEPTGDRTWLGRLYAAEALHLLESDDIVAAESRAESAVAAFVDSGNREEEAEARHRLADIVTLLGDVDRAERLFDEARAGGERANDAALSLRALKGLYQIAFIRRDAQRCRELAQAQLDLGYSSGDRRAEAEGHIAMSNALNMLQIRRRDAREHLEAATKAFTELGSPVSVASSLVITAMQLVANGDLAGARPATARALEIYALHPPPARLKIAALLTMAIVTLISGDGASAIPYAAEAVDLARANAFRLLEAAAVGNLADAEAVAGNYREAIAHDKESLELWAAARETNAGVTFANIALWSAALGDLAEAKTYAFLALERRAEFATASFWPQASEWCLAQAFRACDEADAAAAALERARALTLKALEQIDPEDKAVFLELPWHRDLMAAAESNIWPDPPR